MSLTYKVLQKAFKDIFLRRALVLRLVQLQAAIQVLVQLLAQFSLLVPENGVPIILDRVVWAAKDHITNLGPAIHGTPLKDKEDPPLFKTPGSLLQKRI